MVGILALTPKAGGGVYQYTLSLIEALTLGKRKNGYVIFRNSMFPAGLGNTEVEITINQPNMWMRFKRFLFMNTMLKLGDVVGIYKIPKGIDIDLIIAPSITLAPIYMEKPYIITIHDLQHKYYPHLFTLKERLSRDYVYKKSASKAKLVVCESEYVKEDINNFLNISYEKIKVIPSPPPRYIKDINLDEKIFSQKRKKYNLPDKFLFYPAQFWYHKNHVNLIKAIHHIKCAYKEEIPLILVGFKKNNFENTMNEIRKLNLLGQITYHGYIPEEDMPYLYKLSTALVMPTLFESVSIPIWEAFYLGVPVVSSNVCALPEQVRDAGLLFDPINVEDMAEKIYKIWTDEKLRQDLINNGYGKVKNLTLENYAKHWEIIIEEGLRK